MSKKNRKDKQPEAQASAQEARPAEMVQGPDGQAQAADGRQTVHQDKKYFFIFWAIIVLSAAAAWILAIVMPSVSESIIERWIMAALALALAAFLFVYK